MIISEIDKEKIDKIINNINRKYSKYKFKIILSYY